MKTKHILSVINAAVANGFELDPADSLEDIWQQAEETMLENEPNGRVFVQCALGGHGMSQNYTFTDDDGYSVGMTGEIFDFPKAKADDEVYFRKEGGAFTPVAWYEIPDGEERKDYVFVFDKQVRSDGAVAYLYDHLA